MPGTQQVLHECGPWAFSEHPVELMTITAGQGF